MKRLLFVVVLLSAVSVAAARYHAASGGEGQAEQTRWSSRLRVGNPIQQGDLTIFPVFGGPAPDTSGFLTLDEGLAQGLVKVGEFGTLLGTGRMMRPQPDRSGPPVWSERLPYPRPSPAPAPQSARVNELAIQNLSDRPLILLAGEIVTGGKQDRVVGRDRIVPPHSEPLPLDVFCVEPGRWQGLSATFAAANTMAHPSLRQEVTEARNQQRVWDEVAQSRDGLALALAEPTTGEGRGTGVGGAIGGTTSYAQTVQAKPVQERLVEKERALARDIPANAVGIVVAVGGKIAWADVFTSPALFARYRDKLLQSYAVEVTRRGGPAGRGARAQQSDALDFLRPLTGRQTTETEPDLYRLIRTEAAGTVTYELQALNAKTVDLHMARMAR